jgi:hypothetical protein
LSRTLAQSLELRTATKSQCQQGGPAFGYDERLWRMWVVLKPQVAVRFRDLQPGLVDTEVLHLGLPLMITAGSVTNGGPERNLDIQTDATSLVETIERCGG